MTWTDTSQDTHSLDDIADTDVVVVGGGQAGIAMSEHLGAQGIPHLVLERHRVAERWRTERWDGLRANGPAWHDRFPGLEFTSGGPHHFPGRDDIVGYLEDYARQVNAPIRTGVEVRRVGRAPGRAGYAVETSRGAIHAGAVVAATGPFQVPLMPPLIDIDAPVVQMHSNAYRSPEALIPGGVLVVGAGSSGAQIADELNRAGRQVWLSVGPHERPPRRYRGRDFVWWLGVLGKWDAPTPGPSTRHVTIAVSGAEGGQTVDFRRMAARGITLVGMTESYAAGEVHFAPDLERNLAAGDQSLQGLLAEADAFVARRGLDLPAELEAHEIPPDPPCVYDPVRTLDLAGEGISTVIWATGYRTDFSWLDLDVFDTGGNPAHSRGVTDEPGVYFLGLPWLSRRGSSFIWGVWHDARFIADQIAIQRAYMDHHRVSAPVPHPSET